MNKATDLHQAAREGNVKLVKELIAKGADVNAHDYYGNTLLHKAAWSGHKEVAELLMKHGGKE